MRHLLVMILLSTSAFTDCVGWDEYYGKEANSLENSQGGPEMIAIQAGKPGSYYLVDQTRALCFFQNGEALTAVDCSSIPEAAQLLGETSQPPRRTERIPNPIRSTTSQKKEGPSEATAQELEAFKATYSDIVCKSRQGVAFSPRNVIIEHDLTVERYTQLEGILARQKKEWSALTRSAAQSCKPASDKHTTSQPDDLDPETGPDPLPEK